MFIFLCFITQPVLSNVHISVFGNTAVVPDHALPLDLLLISLCLSQDVYKGLLPLYFPRNIKEEVYAADLLPRDVGNESGEPIVVDRQIRILDKPAFAALSM